MLTKDRIAAAREVVEWWRMNPSGFRPGGNHLPTIDAALAAYERVMALLAEVKLCSTDCVTAGDWYDRGRAEAYAEVRRALEG